MRLIRDGKMLGIRRGDRTRAENLSLVSLEGSFWTLTPHNMEPALSRHWHGGSREVGVATFFSAHWKMMVVKLLIQSFPAAVTPGTHLAQHWNIHYYSWKKKKILFFCTAASLNEEGTKGLNALRQCSLSVCVCCGGVGGGVTFQMNIISLCLWSCW